MTAEKNKAEPSALGGAAGTLPTVVGVPAIVPTPAVPPPPPSGSVDDQLPTAVALKPVTAEQAEQVLSDKPPMVVGALPIRPAAGTPAIKTPPLTGEMFKGLGRPPQPARPTRAGVAPTAGTAPKGRSTLLLDGSAPPAPPNPSAEGPSIVVPPSGAPAPKAVTQPPPWGEGAARIAPPIPGHAPPPRGRSPSFEEISSSMLLPDASGEGRALEELSGSMLLPADASGAAPAAGVEELSGSMLVEDAPDGSWPPAVTIPASAAPSARVPSKPPPPLPASSRPPPVQGTRTMLGMPELPKVTPGPKLEFLPYGPSIPPVPTAPPVVEGLPGFAPAAPVTAPLPYPPAHAPVAGALAPAVPVAPPVIAPPASPVSGDVEVTQLPQPLVARLAQRLRSFGQRVAAAFPDNRLLRPEGRPPWFFPVVALAGLIVGIGVMGLFVAVARAIAGGSDGERAAPSASAGPPPGPSIVAPAPAPPPPPAPPPELAPCAVAGTPHVLAPSATLAAGVEVLLAGTDLAVGFAPSDKDAMAVRLDAASLTASATAKARSHEPVRRVTPVINQKGSLSLVVDVDHKGDRLAGRRTLRAAAPIQLGTSPEGQLVWARPGAGPSGTLWPLGDGGPADAIRGGVDGAEPSALGVAFRRGASVWVGTLDVSNGVAPKGDVGHLDGLGPSVGSPAVAMNAGVGLLAWADRASAEEPWQIRVARFEAGGAPASARTFPAPAGGKGEPFMSPSLAALPGGRFLLVWTEGPASGHVVRAVTLGSDAMPVGAPLELSAEGANAGQGQAAVAENGAGIVAFLESGKKGFEVAATSIVCGHP